ncbi:MAG: prepilin peptidase [Sneathiella sp.]|nr:prepilin peptidase [Sneathiella sp.]
MLVTIFCTGLLLLGAALWDVRFRLIPNALSLTVFCLFLLHIVLNGLWTEAPGHLLVGGGVFIAGLILYALGWFGGGDVKLFAALAFWAGPEHFFTLTIITTLAGGVLGLVYLMPVLLFKSPAVLIGANWFFETAFSKPAPTFFVSDIKGIELPYGVAIATGGMAILHSITVSG